MATTKKSTAGGRKAPGTKAPARRPAAPKAAAPSAPVATAPVASKPGSVVLVSTAKGSRTFQDARGIRRTVVTGEAFEVDGPTARILLRSEPDAFARASDAPELEVASAPTGPITVADLGAGGAIAKPAEASTEATATSSAATPPVDAAPAASSDGGDQGGSEAVNDPGATASGETATPPSSEATSTETAAAAAGPGAEVLT